ncbi:MAG: hypothetical protein ABIB93_02440, partial [Chloroflexota bacterium]
KQFPGIGVSVMLYSGDIPQDMDYYKLEKKVIERLANLYTKIKQKRKFTYREGRLHLEFTALRLRKKIPTVWNHPNMPARWAGTEQIRNVIEKKINNYGFVKKQKLPFVIALILHDVPAGENGLINALHGQPAVTVHSDSNDNPIKVTEGRNYNGLVTPKPGENWMARNTRLSGVINVLSKLEDRDNDQKERVHYMSWIPNHWACNPLQADFMKGYPILHSTESVSDNETKISWEWLNGDNPKVFDC